MLKTKGGIFLFNIIPSYRPGMRKVFDYGFYELACVPSIAQRCKQNSLFVSFEDIAGESLTDLDLLYVFATDAADTFARINWINPGTFPATDGAAGPTFTENEGFQGNGSTQYMTTGWDPATNAVALTQNDAGVFVFSNTDVDAAGSTFLFGSRNASNQHRIEFIPKNVSSLHVAGLNSTGTTSGLGSSVSSQGFFHIKRIAADDLRVYKNGSQVGSTQTTASTGLSSNDVAILASNGNGSIGGYSEEQVGCLGIGASLTGQESALYTAWNTYFTSL